MTQRYVELLNRYQARDDSLVLLAGISLLIILAWVLIDQQHIKAQVKNWLRSAVTGIILVVFLVTLLRSIHVI